MKEMFKSVEDFGLQIFLKNFCYNRNFSMEDLDVHFYHNIAIQPTAGCLNRQNQNHKVSHLFCTQV